MTFRDISNSIIFATNVIMAALILFVFEFSVVNIILGIANIAAASLLWKVWNIGD